MTATKLWMRTSDYIFALGELQAFAGASNVASGADVTSFDSIEGGRWGRKALVDGFDSRKPLATTGDGSLEVASASNLRLPWALPKTERLLGTIKQADRDLADAGNGTTIAPPTSHGLCRAAPVSSARSLS